MALRLIWHELFAWHDAGNYTAAFVEPLSIPDTAEPKRRIRNLVEASGLIAHLDVFTPSEASDKALARAHDEDYVARVRATGKAGGDIARYARIGPGGDRIARLAAGAAIAAVDAVVEGKFDAAYALVRPAGHHATRGDGGGFCIFNNVAVAALHALEEHGLARVAIVDWDVHHGNGTQDIFWRDDRVLAISIHQEMLHAGGGGAVDEIGEAAGRGTTLNIPLPPGSGEGAYLAAMRQVVVPALDRFRPDLILVACGLDAASHDPLGRMMLHSESFRALTHLIRDAALRLCGGRLAFCHEGGYSAAVAPFAGLAIIEALAGISMGVEDPFVANARKQPGQALQPHQQRMIELAARNLEFVPGRL